MSLPLQLSSDKTYSAKSDRARKLIVVPDVTKYQT
jgi:hypothetical protein